MPDYKSIGKPMKILDGHAKVTGAARYTADLDTPGLLHARLVTSLYAHANLRGIDAAAALDVPGVVAVLTAADLPDIKPTSRMKLLLARGRVMFAGQPIALVLGETEAAAGDGAAAVQVDMSRCRPPSRPRRRRPRARRWSGRAACPRPSAKALMAPTPAAPARRARPTATSPNKPTTAAATSKPALPKRR